MELAELMVPGVPPVSLIIWPEEELMMLSAELLPAAVLMGTLRYLKNRYIMK